MRGKAVLAVVLLLLLAELPLASAYQVRGWCAYSTFGCPGGGGGDISGIGLGGLGALSLALPQLLEELGVLPRPQSADNPKTGAIDAKQPSPAGGPQTGAVRVDSQQQVEAAKDSIVKRRDITIEEFKDRAREKGWTVEELKPGEMQKTVTKRELLEFMKANERKLRGILGRDYDELYRRIEESRYEITRQHDVLLKGNGKWILVEEKNVEMLSANRLHVLREMLIDIYLNVEKGVKVVWHFSESSTGGFYRTLIHAFNAFGVEYWVGSHVPSP